MLAIPLPFLARSGPEDPLISLLRGSANGFIKLVNATAYGGHLILRIGLCNVVYSLYDFHLGELPDSRFTATLSRSRKFFL